MYSEDSWDFELLTDPPRVANVHLVSGDDDIVGSFDNEDEEWREPLLGITDVDKIEGIDLTGLCRDRELNICWWGNVLAWSGWITFCAKSSKDDSTVILITDCMYRHLSWYLSNKMPYTVFQSKYITFHDTYKVECVGLVKH